MTEKLGVDYLQAVNQVHRFGRGLAGFFEDYDLLVTPTLAEPPARIGRFVPDNEDFLDHRLGPTGILPYSPYTPAFNVSGQPAMSVPLHWNSAGLPIGVHIAGRFGAAPWFGRRPPPG